MTTIFTYLALTIKLTAIGFVATATMNHATPVTNPQPETKPATPVTATAEYIEELTGKKISPNATIITIDGVTYRISH